MKRREKRRRGIRFRVLSCLFAFTAVTVLVLWLAQNVFLSSIYQSIKTSEIRRAADKIAASVTDGTLTETSAAVAGQYDICVIVLSEKGSFAPVSIDSARGCVVHRMNGMGLNLLFNRAQSAQDGILYFNDDGIETHKGDDGELSIVHATTVQTANDTALILLNSVISPVDATVNTLNRILIYVTVVLVVLSVLLALILSEVLARPITRITRGAQQLASGKYDTEFRGGGYAEIDALARTLNYAESELSRVDRLQKELIANISHDLRTPLTMISGYSEIMRDIPGENTPENLQIIIDETERLTSLVNDVLDISKLHSGEQRFERRYLCLTEIAERAMQRYTRLTSGGYDLRFVSHEQLYIYGDQTRVLQVIYNLVNNAVTYTGDDKRVTVTLSQVGDAARIAVTDTGEGVPAEKLADIWERYYKVDEHHKRSAIGTGLGLSIVREIMREHGGHYGVTSTPGAGSTFWVDFPIAKQPPKEQGE